MKKSLLLLVVVATSAFLLLGGKKEQPPKQIPLGGQMVVLDTVAGYSWEQTKDGVTIKLVPVPFEWHVVYHKTVREKPKGLFSVSVGNGVKYVITDDPAGYLFKPDSLTFQLHVTNHMTHVLRFAGSLVSFVADGKSLPLNTRTQDDLLKAVILPQGSLDLIIMGPPCLPQLSGDTTKSVLVTAKTITFSLYDVTTEVDAANNPTKKATFEWIFANTPRSLFDSFPQMVTEETLLPADAANLHNTWFLK